MVWVGRELVDDLVPIPCHGQGHLPLDQVAQSPIQSGLKHFFLKEINRNLTCLPAHYALLVEILTYGWRSYLRKLENLSTVIQLFFTVSAQPPYFPNAQGLTALTERPPWHLGLPTSVIPPQSPAKARH